MGYRGEVDLAAKSEPPQSKLQRAFRHRDFRLMWFGAFLSFTGSWVQNVAQGYMVYQLTKSNEKLALVSFMGMLPVTILGPIAGAITDSFDKRKLLVVTQAIFAIGACYLAAATYWGWVSYAQILIVAFVLGAVSAVEMPTRQSIVGRVVPPEDLSVAIPLNALTFNMARVIGPAIGGLLLAHVGVDACYLVNGLSFFALIFAGLAVHADLRAAPKEPQPILDLILEGGRYTLREPRLRALFLLECMVSSFGLFYLSQMPAIAEQMLGIGKSLGNCFLAVGVGSVSSLLVVTTLSHRPVKTLLVKIAVTLMSLSLLALSFVHAPLLAYVLFALLGLSAVAIFNTCNTLFQTLSPDRLRGRVLSMHIWALAGIGPFGVLLFGYIAQHLGLPIALQIGGAGMAVTAIAGWLATESLRDPVPEAAGVH